MELDSAIGTMSGASIWNTDFLQVGAYGTGTINITDASKLTVSGGLNMGTHRNGTTLRFGTGTISITGAGSELTSTGTTIVGDQGVGSISVSGGGKLTTGSTTVGKETAGQGTVTISGAGSRWMVNGTPTVTIGQNGTGTVTITDGGSFDSAGMVAVGADAGTGTLTVTGAGSTLKAAQIRVGGNGSGTDGTGTLNAQAGAVVDATHLMLGNMATGSGTATISGPNTSVSASTYAMVGWQGTGELTLSDSATFKTPLTLVGFSAGSNGTLNIGAAAGSGAAAAGTLDSAEVRFGSGTGTLVFNHTASDLAFAPKITGSGTVRHLAGTTVFNADSSAFAGTTIMDGGTLEVLGKLGGTVAVGSTAMLRGSGTVGTTTVNSGGTLDPTGTLNVAGNLTFDDGATFLVNYGNGTADQVIATGTAALDGSVKVQPGGTLGWDEARRVLAASAISGTFDGISSTSAFVDAALDYATLNEVWVKLQRNGVKFEDVATTDTQKTIGEILTSLPVDDTLVVAMSALSAAEAREAMEQLAGDTHATVAGGGAMVAGQVQGVAMNRIRQSFSTLGSGPGVVSSYLPSDYAGEYASGQPVTVWVQGLGEYTHIRPTTSAGGLDSGTGGVLAGVDTLINDWRVGAIGGYTGTRFNAVGRTATGSVNNIHAGIYGGADLDPVRVQFNALQTWHGISSRREVDFGGFSDTLSANYGSSTSMLFGEVGHGFDLGSVEVEPFGSVSYALTNTAAYTESGGAAALSSAASHNQSLTTVVGARGSTSLALGDKLVTVSAMLGWQHHSGQAPSNEFTLSGSQPFTVTGANPSSDALVYETGLNLDYSEQLNFDLLYSGRAGRDEFSHAIKGVVAASF